MTNALTIICQGLDKMKPQIKQSLPKGLDVDRFIRTAFNAIQMHPQKDKLAKADRQSIYNSCLKAAFDGLQIDGREAALVVFYDKNSNSNQAQYMPMVQGLVKLARNSGEISSIDSEVVYEHDKFVYRIGLDDMPLHEPDWFGDRGEPVGVWACVKLKSGEVISRLLPKDKIMRIAKASKNSYQYDETKGAHWDEWWRKTAIKNVLKYAPKSSELDRVIQEDDANDFDFDVPIDDIRHEPAKEEKPKEKKTRAQEVIQDEPEIIDADIVEDVEEIPV